MLLMHKDLSSSFPDPHKSRASIILALLQGDAGAGGGGRVTGRGRPPCKLIGLASLVYGFLCSLKLILPVYECTRSKRLSSFRSRSFSCHRFSVLPGFIRQELRRSSVCLPCVPISCSGLIHGLIPKPCSSGQEPLSKSGPS